MRQIKAYKTEDGKIFATQQEAESYEEAQGFKSYQVDLIYSGYARIEIQAKNEDEAIEKAKDQIYNDDIYFDTTEPTEAKAELIK